MKKYRDLYNKQQNMIAAGLVAINLLILQAFIPLDHIDLAIMISIITFAISIPMLVFGALINEIFNTLEQLPVSKGYRFIWNIGLIASVVGIIAAFSHMLFIAGIIIFISGFIGFVVFAGYDAKAKRKLAEESKNTSIF